MNYEINYYIEKYAEILECNPDSLEVNFWLLVPFDYLQKEQWGPYSDIAVF